jgi:glycosyltransferase involved in cell wall biosynthesis
MDDGKINKLSVRKMRVLMVTPGYYPIKGGTETIVRKLSMEVIKIGINVNIMTCNMDRKWNPKWRGKTEKIDGITVFKIPALNWFPIVHSDRVTMGVNLIPGRFTNRLKEYDIIHFHEDLSFPLFSFFSEKPKIFHLHGLHVDFYKRYFLSRLILKHVADLYICLSKLMERDLTDLGVREDRIRRLPNGVDVKIFRPLGEKKDNLVLFVGRICFQKGLHVLLKSLAYLENSIHLVIIGPPGWDSEYFKGMLEFIEKENKKGKHKITYLGAQNHASIVKWYQKASVFVLPSVTSEALGIVNLEALCCETPVVSTNVGGIPEVVCDGKNGILVQPSNAAKLAEAIQYFLDNKDVRKKFGKNGRKWVVENFSFEAMVKRLCQIYKELIR